MLQGWKKADTTCCLSSDAFHKSCSCGQAHRRGELASWDNGLLDEFVNHDFPFGLDSNLPLSPNCAHEGRAAAMWHNGDAGDEPGCVKEAEECKGVLEDFKDVYVGRHKI